MPHTIVLSVGRDSLLSETRCRVLQAAGYTVVSSLSPRQAMDQLLQGDFDLVILCHSIPVEDRERLAFVIREHTWRTPIVCVAPNVGQCDPFADATIENDPVHLVAGLHQLLRRARPYSSMVPVRDYPASDNATQTNTV